MLRRVVSFLIGFTLMWGVLGTRYVFAMGSTQFGTYSQAYLDRQQIKKWKILCKGGGRYQAMAEAYNAGKPDPCNPAAKEWVR